MYCHIHHCHYHHCNCVPTDSKENEKALTQEELLALTQEMKQELKDYTVDLKDQIFSYIDIGLNPVEIANSINSLKEQDTYILRTLTNKIDELNNTTNLSMFNLKTRVTDLEGQSATLIKDLAELDGKNSTNTADLIDRTQRIVELESKTIVVESVAALSTIKNPKDGLRVYVKSYHSGLSLGGGEFIYDSSKADINDGGIGFNGWVRQLNYGNISLTMFGAKPSSTFSSSEAMRLALTYCILTKQPLHIPSGDFLFDTSIDLDLLPQGNFQILGSESCHINNNGNTILRGGLGLDKLFKQSFGKPYRNLVFKNLSIGSKDPWTDTVRAPLKAFELFSSPHSVYENIDFLGIKSGIHVRTAWLCKFKNITTSRVDEGVFIDGDDGQGGYGWSDQCVLDNIIVGSHANAGGWGLRMRGSKASTVRGLNMESGRLSNGLVVEGCKNLSVDGIYTESYQAVNPILIRGIDGSPLTNLEDFAINIKLKNIYSNSTGSTSQTTAIVLVSAGVIDVEIDGVYSTRVDLAGRSSMIGPIVAFSGITNDPNANLVTQNIQLINCGASQRIVTQLESTAAEDRYRSLFSHNGVIFQKFTNKSYYGLTIHEGMTLVDLLLNTKQVCVSRGTIATTYSAVAQTTAKSRIITVDNTTNLKVGTFITVGDITGLLVSRIDGLTVYLGREIPTTATGVAVKYTAPTLI